MGWRDKYEELAPQEIANLDEARKWVLAHCSEPRATETPLGKVWLIRELLAKGFAQPDEVLKLQSLGILFGDALAQEIPLLSWKRVTDRFGRSPALVFGNTALVVYPVSIIQKRVQRGEVFDAIELFSAQCAHIRDVSRKPNLANRPAVSSRNWKAWIFGRLTSLRGGRGRTSSSGTDRNQ